MYCAGDAAFYRNMLADYADSCEKRLSELEAALHSDNIKEYQTLVHALKSISKTVGADDVSELARSLEDAAKRDDATDIRSRHGTLAELFTEKAAAIRRILN